MIALISWWRAGSYWRNPSVILIFKVAKAERFTDFAIADVESNMDIELLLNMFKLEYETYLSVELMNAPEPVSKWWNEETKTLGQWMINVLAVFNIGPKPSERDPNISDFPFIKSDLHLNRYLTGSQLGEIDLLIRYWGWILLTLPEFSADNLCRDPEYYVNNGCLWREVQTCRNIS